MEIIPEPEWEAVVEEIIKHKGVALLLGATDSGKSTLAKYLIKELLSRNVIISLIDSDIGQSSLGLPGTISMKIFNKREDFDAYKPDRIFFIGDVNPSGHILLMIEGTKKMVDIAKAEGVKTILVDTTGLIGGGLGKAVKIAKIKAIKPKHIIAVQRADELEHILSLIEGIRIHRLNVSRHARKRSREKRIRYRDKKYEEYFRGSRSIWRSCKGLEFFYYEKEIDIEEKYLEPGRLVGINRDEETVALGIFKGIRQNRVAIRSPLKSFAGVNRVVAGDIIY